MVNDLDIFSDKKIAYTWTGAGGIQERKLRGMTNCSDEKRRESQHALEFIDSRPRTEDED